MGSGTSRAADPRLDTLPAVEKRGEVALVSVLPEDEALRKVRADVPQGAADPAAAMSRMCLPGPDFVSRLCCPQMLLSMHAVHVQKDEVLLLEVGPEGLRLLRPGMEVPVGGWKWPQIHSWESSRVYFSFKFYEEK